MHKRASSLQTSDFHFLCTKSGGRRLSFLPLLMCLEITVLKLSHDASLFTISHLCRDTSFLRSKSLCCREYNFSINLN